MEDRLKTLHISRLISGLNISLEIKFVISLIFKINGNIIENIL